MKLAIMQPYFFPYLGYFQLLFEADKFVVYDDVNFIKQGWINRNRILVNGEPKYFTVPLENISSFRAIRETKINTRTYLTWKSKFLKTLEQSYSKAPHFEVTMNLIRNTIENPKNNVAELAYQSINDVQSFLGIDTKVIPSSSQYKNKDLSRTERIIDICNLEKSNIYINMINGSSLYSKKEFAASGIELKFLEPTELSYKQFNNEFASSLSIIDVLMFNSKDVINNMLKNYRLS